jgi:hypothetical protein
MGGANKPHPFYKIKQGVSAMYITKKDYFDARGIDLEIELKGSVTDNPSKKVEIFISQIEEWLINYLASKYDFNEGMILATALQESAFKKAVIYQIDYIRRNGNLSVDSENTKQVLSPDAYNVLFNAGFCNILRGCVYGH